MKKLKKFACVWLGVAFCVGTLFANEPYKSLSTPLADEKHSVIEVFSFACGACYTHHKLGTMSRTKERLPKLSYKVYPIKAIQFGEEFARLYAYADAKDRAKGRDYATKNSLMHKLADAYFVALFERNQNWGNSQSFYALGLKTLGISQKELDKFVTSTQGRQILAEYDRANSVAMEYGGTPAFAVGGKYLIMMREIQSLDDFMGLVERLDAK